MNGKQIVALALGAVMVCLFLVFPPWVGFQKNTFYATNETLLSEHRLQWSVNIFRPPPLRKVWVDPFEKRDGWTEVRYRIDWERLTLQLALVVTLSGIAMALLSDRHRPKG